MNKLLALCSLLAACPAPPCDEAACRAECRGFAVGGADVLQPMVLSASEVMSLGDLLGDLRKGPSGDEGGSGVCGGAAGPCAAFVRGPTDPELGPGPHRLTLAYRTPKAAQTGDATVEAKVLCLSASHGQAEPVEFYTSARLPLPATEGRTERVDVTSLAEGISLGRCVWEMTLEGPQGERTLLEGEALIGAWARRSDRLPEDQGARTTIVPETGP